jgi:hypothetical protein
MKSAITRDGHDVVDGLIDVRKIEFLTDLLHDVVHVTVQILSGRDRCPIVL